MKCYNCDGELKWLCDYDVEEEGGEHPIITELSCSSCNVLVVVQGDQHPALFHQRLQAVL